MKHSVDDIDEINLAEFLQDTTNQRVQDLDTVQTKALQEATYNREMKKAAAKTVKGELQKYKALTAIQQKPGMIIDFAPEALKEPEVAPDDEVDRFLREARVVQDKPAKPSRNFRAPGEEESSSQESDDPLPDVNEIILNQNTIRDQQGEMLRLRAVLLTNEQKLRQWARIKSRKFRRIHNREQRQKKMNELLAKLQGAGQAGKALGLDDYCVDLIQAQMQQAQKQLQDNGELGMKTGEVDGTVAPKKGTAALRFMSNYLDKQQQILDGESSGDSIDEQGNLVTRKRLHQQQNYTEGVQEAAKRNSGKAEEREAGYDDNPFLDGVDPEVAKQQSASSVQKAALQLDLIRAQIQKQDAEEAQHAEKRTAYDPAARFQKFIADRQVHNAEAERAFESQNEIQALKAQEIDKTIGGDFQEALPGWGAWAGDGVSVKEKERESFKKEVRRQQKITAYLKEEQERTDAGKTWLFQAQAEGNREAQRKYAARGLKVSDEEYARYLRQQITPDFQSVSGFRYVTQQERNVPRGMVLHQQREMERNVQELQKIQRQLEEQKQYVRGQKVSGATRKAQF